MSFLQQIAGVSTTTGESLTLSTKGPTTITATASPPVPSADAAVATAVHSRNQYDPPNNSNSNCDTRGADAVTDDQSNNRKSLSQLVWTHVTASERADGSQEQTCNYCQKTKISKQLQTTFWCKHMVDQGKKGCPSCPIDVRLLLASKSGSADVQRAAAVNQNQNDSSSFSKKHSSSGSKKQAAKRKKQKMMLKSCRQFVIACICGSQRTGSFNRMLHDSAMDRLAEEGAAVVTIDLKALNLPLYDPDLESENFPAAAQKLKNDLISADGILITCPEYNGFISPLLLNSITWATRGEGRMYAGFKNKVVSLMSTSPGAMGGMRMLRSLQQMMQDMGAIVVPGNTSIGNAFHVFDREGRVVDERAFKKISTACYQLVHLAQSHASRDIEDPMEEEVIKLPNMGEYGRADW